MQKILFALLPLIFLSLTACLEFHEVIQLNPDGTAQITLHIKLPDLGKKKSPSQDSEEAKAEVRDMVGGLSQNYKMVKNETREENGVSTVEMSALLPSLMDVREFYKKIELKEKESKKEPVKKSKDEFEQLFTKSDHFKIKRVGDNLKITRSFTPPKMPKPKPAKDKDGKDKDFNKDIEDAILNAFYFTFEFVPPASVVSSNATWVVSNTYRWETSLGYLIKSPFLMEIEIPSTPELSTQAGKK